MADAGQRRGSALAMYLREVERIHVPDKQEMQKLCERLADDDPSAREDLIVSHLSIVPLVASRYKKRGVDIEDLICEGNLGLLRAIEGYDGSRGVPFDRYAKHWVKACMIRSLNRDGPRLSGISANVAEILGRWRVAYARLTQRIGRTPTEAEVAKILRIAPRKLEFVIDALRAMVYDECSLLGEYALLALVADPRSVSAQQIIEEVEAREIVNENLSMLDSVESLVVRLRFGFDTDEPLSLSQTSAIVGLPEETVRSRQRSAIRKLARAITEY